MPRRLTFPAYEPDDPDQIVGKAWKLLLTALLNFGAGPRRDTYSGGKAVEALQRIGVSTRRPDGVAWRLRREGGAVLFQDQEFDKLVEALSWWRTLKSKDGVYVVTLSEHRELRLLDELLEHADEVDLNDVVGSQEAKSVEAPPDT